MKSNGHLPLLTLFLLHQKKVATTTAIIINTIIATRTPIVVAIAEYVLSLFVVDALVSGEDVLDWKIVSDVVVPEGGVDMSSVNGGDMFGPDAEVVVGESLGLVAKRDKFFQKNVEG